MDRVFGDVSGKERPEQVASAQYGLLSRWQARALGISKDSLYRRVRSGKWEVVFPGVYRIAGSPSSWHQVAMAACLWAGRGAAISHRAAAALWGFGGFAPQAVELSTTRKLTNPGLAVVVHEVRRLSPEEVLVVSMIHVTTPTRTLLDLGGVVEEELVEATLDEALRRGMTTIPRLRRALAQSGRRGRRGVGVIRELLNQRGPGETPAGSVLETRLMRLLQKAGLPRPKRQYEIKEGGKLIARVDLAYPEVRLAIEADGYKYHSGKAAWQHDRVRRNALTTRGWKVLHVTWDDLRWRAPVVIREIGELLVKNRA